MKTYADPKHWFPPQVPVPMATNGSLAVFNEIVGFGFSLSILVLIYMTFLMLFLLMKEFAGILMKRKYLFGYYSDQGSQSRGGKINAKCKTDSVTVSCLIRRNIII